MQRVGLVGAGYWGKNLARNFHALGVLGAICDHNLEAQKRSKERLPDARITSDYQELLNDPKITAIAIATPAGEHYWMAKAALEAGKDLYVEKPLSLDLAEAEELVDLAHRLGRILMVGHILQYHPCVKRLYMLIEDGVLGKLHHITSNRLNLGKICTVENALWALAPHDLSVILKLAGELPDQVRCIGGAYLTEDVADTTLTSLHFPSGIRAQIHASWLNPYKEQKLTVVGSEGMILFDDAQGWGQKLLLFRQPIRWVGPIPIPDGSVSPEPVGVEADEPLRAECSHFIECCRTRRTPLTSGEEALAVTRVLSAAEESLRAQGELRSACPDSVEVL